MNVCVVNKKQFICLRKTILCTY